MSGHAHTVVGMTWWRVNPWRMLRRAEAVTLEWHDDGPRGRSRHSTQTVSIRRGLTWEQRRCAVLHELLHLERGPVPRGLAAKEEEQVRRETAARMIPEIRDVLAALLWAHSNEEAAEELGVDIAVLDYRLAHMSPMEESWLLHRIREARGDDGHGLGAEAS